MYGVTLIITLAIMGGIIAFLGDRLGYKLGKKRLSVFGMRPRDTSTFMAVLGGMLVAGATLGALSVVSSDVRTALFGMEKLKTQLETMQTEVSSKNKELVSLQDKLKASNDEMQELTIERDKANRQLLLLTDAQKEAYAELDKYRAESEQLEAVREKLQAEITGLERETKDLESGIIALREGRVAFRRGQVIYAGIIRAGQDEKETLQTLNDFLSFANRAVADALGVEKKDMQLIFVTEPNFSQTVDLFLKNKGPMAVRLQSSGNILLGEPVLTEFNIYPNKLIYGKNDVIYRENVPASVDKATAEAILLAFLSRLNAKVVKDGLLPDPISGNVGNMDMPYMMEVMNKIRTTQGAFSITATAKNDISTLGPLQINIDIRSRS